VSRLGNLEEGEALIEEAYALNHWDYHAMYALVSVRLRQGDLEGALELLERLANEDAPIQLKMLAIDHIQNIKRYIRP